MSNTDIRFIKRSTLSEHFATSPINKNIYAALKTHTNKNDNTILNILNTTYRQYVFVMSDRQPAEHIEEFYEDAQQTTDDADAVFSILSGILLLHHQSDKVADLLSCLQQKIKNQYILSVFMQTFAPLKDKVKIDTLFFDYAYDLSYTDITNWQEATNNFTPSEIRRFIESGQNDMERKEILNAIYLDYESKKASIHLPQVDFSQFRSAIAETNLKERITELTAENQRLNSTIHALNQDQDDNGTISISSFIKASKSLSTHDAQIILSFLKSMLAARQGNWIELIKIEIEQRQKEEPLPLSQTPLKGPYRIAKDKVTTFVKLLKFVCQTHIFENLDGSLVSNVETFTKDVGAYFNTTIAKPSTLLSAAKETSNFLDYFQTLLTYAEKYYTKESNTRPPTNHNNPALF